METTTSTPGVWMCHKLTRDHVWLTSFTRMRVYLAAQVSIVCGNPPMLCMDDFTDLKCTGILCLKITYYLLWYRS